MSLIVSTAPRPEAGEDGVLQTGWLSRALLASLTWLRCHVERRRAVAQLNAMTDWQLHDIGLTRADILDAVAGRLKPQR